MKRISKSRKLVSSTTTYQETSDKRQALVCIHVEINTEAAYIKLIEAFCSNHEINIIKVGDTELLGTCDLDWSTQDGKDRKVMGCGCIVVKDYGVDSEGMPVILDYFRTRF